MPASRELPLDGVTAELLLSGRDLEPDQPPDHHALARVLRAAARPASEQELAGEPAYVAALVAAANESRASVTAWSRPRRRRRGVTRRVAALVAAITMALVAGAYATAMAGVLPAPAQRWAHAVFAVPAPHEHGSPQPTVGQSPSRPATTPGGSSPPATPQPSRPAASSTGSGADGGNGPGNDNGNGAGNSSGNGAGNSPGNGAGKNPGNSPGNGGGAVNGDTGGVGHGKGDGAGNSN